MSFLIKIPVIMQYGQEKIFDAMFLVKYMLLIIISIIPSIVISQEYCNFIEKVQNYQDSAKVISVKYKSNAFHIVDTNTFKTRTYLSFFDKIENEKGFRIRMYYFGGRDGNPYLYALKENEKLNYNRRYNLYKVLNRPNFRAKII